MSQFTLSDHNHNLRLNLVHEFFWGFGLAFHTVYAVIPLFLRELGAPNGIAVSVGGLFTFLMAVPQLITAIIGRNIRNIKFAVLLVHSLIWVPIFIMGATFTFFPPSGSSAWVFYLFLFSIYGLGLGVVIPIWADFLNAVTLRKVRGTFFGFSFAFGSIGSFFGGMLLKYILESSLAFPRNFGVGFFIFFGSTVIATVIYFGYRVNENRPKRKKLPLVGFLKLTKTVMKGDKNLQKYILSRIFYCAFFPAVSLYPVYCQNKFEFEIGEAGNFTIINVIASGVASYFTGKVGQLYGHKLGLAISYFAHILAVVMAIFSQNMIWVYGVFLCIGIANGAFMPSAMNLVYDFAADRDNKLYIALIDSILAPFVILFIVFVGILTELKLFYIALIAIGGSFFVGFIVLILFVKDPGLFPKFSIEK
jgi:MFS family permease